MKVHLVRHTAGLSVVKRCLAALAGLARSVDSNLDSIIQGGLLGDRRSDNDLDVEHLACILETETDDDIYAQCR